MKQKSFCDVAVFPQYQDREMQQYMNGLVCTIFSQDDRHKKLYLFKRDPGVKALSISEVR